jgi:hypothetical protein
VTTIPARRLICSIHIPHWNCPLAGCSLVISFKLRPLEKGQRFVPRLRHGHLTTSFPRFPWLKCTDAEVIAGSASPAADLGQDVQSNGVDVPYVLSNVCPSFIGIKIVYPFYVAWDCKVIETHSVVEI